MIKVKQVVDLGWHLNSLLLEEIWIDPEKIHYIKKSYLTANDIDVELPSNQCFSVINLGQGEITVVGDTEYFLSLKKKQVLLG